MTATILKAENLSLGYHERTIIRNLELEPTAGRMTAIFGPNGCGKSTPLRALIHLIRPTGGRVSLDDQDYTRSTRAVWRGGWQFYRKHRSHRTAFQFSIWCAVDEGRPCRMHARAGGRRYVRTRGTRCQRTFRRAAARRAEEADHGAVGKCTPGDPPALQLPLHHFARQCQTVMFLEPDLCGRNYPIGNGQQSHFAVMHSGRDAGLAQDRCGEPFAQAVLIERQTGRLRRDPSAGPQYVGGRWSAPASTCGCRRWRRAGRDPRDRRAHYRFRAMRWHRKNGIVRSSRSPLPNGQSAHRY